MRKKAIVLRVSDDGSVQVRVRRQSACDTCRACDGCDECAQSVTVTAKNPIGAKPGDTVYVQTPTSVVFTAVFTVYVLPVVLFFTGYALFALLDFSGALGGVIGFALAVLLAIAVNRIVKKSGRLRYVLAQCVEA